MTSALEIIANLANSAGIQGDGPGGLNAMQRALLPVGKNAEYEQQSALMKLAQTPGFSDMSPAVQNSEAMRVTGDPAKAQKFTALMQLGQMNLNNPQQFIQRGIQSGNISPTEGLGAITNPMLMQGSGNIQTTPPSPDTTAPAQTPSQPPETGDTSKPSAPGLNLQYLNTNVPPFYRNQVLDYIQGGELAKDVSPKDRTLISNWAHNVDPTFTETKGTERNKMAGDIASNAAGTQGGQAVQINSVVGHLYDLHEAAPTLDNGSVPWANAAGNFITGAAGRAPASPLDPNSLNNLNNYNAILERASPELNKFYVGGEGDATGRAAAKEAFAPSLPANVIQNAARTQIGLLKSKTEALQNKRDQIMGAATSSVLTPTAQALMDDMNGRPLTKEQQTMINSHRIESNLPPKNFGYSSMPLPQAGGTQNQNIATSGVNITGTNAAPPAQAAPAPQKPALSPEIARAELERRKKIKEGK